MILEPGANTVAIKSVVQDRINRAQVSRQYGKELAFRLPSSECNKLGGKICYAIRSHVMKLVYSLSVACVYFCLNVFCATFQCDLNN